MAAGELKNLVLLTLYEPVQARDIKLDDKGSLIPATFKGEAVVTTNDEEKKVKLTTANVRLVRAARCPG
jgi:hypothetical protein